MAISGEEEVFLFLIENRVAFVLFKFDYVLVYSRLGEFATPWYFS